jgi:hypothetical protein
MSGVQLSTNPISMWPLSVWRRRALCALSSILACANVFGVGCGRRHAMADGDKGPTTAPVENRIANIEPAELTPRLRRLVEMGTNGYEIKYLEEGLFSPTEVQATVDHIVRHQDASSFHLLDALRQVAPPRYAALPAEIKARILCAGMARQANLNDWLRLPQYPSHRLNANDADSPMAALVATGHAAFPSLLPLLEDKRPGYFYGSKESTTSTEWRYRRCDFAHRAATLILAQPYVLKADVAKRDREIDIIRRQMLQRIAEGGMRPTTAPT